MFQKSKAGVMVKTEHDKTRERRKQTNITSETMIKGENRFDKNQSINRGNSERERRGYGGYDERG